MKFLILTLLAIPISAFAKADIKVNSFLMNDSKSSTATSAELCGTITESGVNHKKIIIIADPGQKEGHYVVNTMPDGSFCHIIRTVHGLARVSAFDTHRRQPRSNSIIYTLKK